MPDRILLPAVSHRHHCRTDTRHRYELSAHCGGYAMRRARVALSISRTRYFSASLSPDFVSPFWGPLRRRASARAPDCTRPQVSSGTMIQGAAGGGKHMPCELRQVA